jgi:hypothetical protein
MFRLEEQVAGRWQLVNEHIYRTHFRALAAARTRTAQHGRSHRVLDLNDRVIADWVAVDSVTRSHYRFLRCGTLGDLDRGARHPTTPDT